MKNKLNKVADYLVLGGPLLQTFATAADYNPTVGDNNQVNSVVVPKGTAYEIVRKKVGILPGIGGERARVTLVDANDNVYGDKIGVGVGESIEQSEEGPLDPIILAPADAALTLNLAITNPNGSPQLNAQFILKRVILDPGAISTDHN